MKVYLVQEDNGQDWEDHRCITVALFTTILAAEDYIQKQGTKQDEHIAEELGEHGYVSTWDRGFTWSLEEWEADTGEDFFCHWPIRTYDEHGRVREEAS